MADKLTELIGIDVETASGLIAAVREGLPFDVFVNLQRVLDIPAAPLADLLGIPPRTFNRRKHEGQFRPEESDGLMRVARVVSRTFDLFEDRAAAILWLKTPEVALDDVTPLSLLDTEVGAQEWNYVINPLHPKFADTVRDQPEPFQFDPRLPDTS